jgi:outer membrane protein TolC
MSTHSSIQPLCAALACALAACHSAKGWGENADQEVYPIVEGRRAELGAKDAFTIEPPPEPLRVKLETELRESGTAEISLDLVGCLKVAAENSRDWQDQREALFQTALDLTLQRWNFSVQQNGTVGAFVADIGPGTPDSQGILSNLNLFKLLGIGTQITANVGIDLLRDVATGNAWDALSHLSLNITQPILRGFGEDIVKEPLTQAERNVLYQARSYERFRRTFAVDVAQRFFRVLEQVDRLANEQANYENLTRLRERNEALAEAGRLTDIQVDQARQDEFSAEDRLVAAQRDLAAGLDDLKFVLGLPVQTKLVLTENGLRTMEAWPALTDELPEDVAVRLGLAKRLDHLTTLDRVADAERGVHVAADALRMGLDVSAAGAVTSIDRPGKLRIDDSTWRVDLALDLPIDRIPERNAYRSACIDLAASHRAADESADLVTSELRDSLRSLEAARASYRIQSGSVTLAQRRVESAVLNLDAGRASTRDVLEAQESLLDAQNTAAGALTDTILAGLFLYRDMELLDVTDHGLEVLRVDAGAPPPGSGALPDSPPRGAQP